MNEIYVVKGTTGEWSARIDWPVCWFFEELAAQEFVRICEENAAEVKPARDACEILYEPYPKDRPELHHKYDPHFRCDKFTGTFYYYEKVSKGIFNPLTPGESVLE